MVLQMLERNGKVTLSVRKTADFSERAMAGEGQQSQISKTFENENFGQGDCPFRNLKFHITLVMGAVFCLKE